MRLPDGRIFFLQDGLKKILSQLFEGLKPHLITTEPIH